MLVYIQLKWCYKLLTVMGDRSEVAGDPVSWKHSRTSSALTHVLATADDEEEEGGGATI